MQRRQWILTIITGIVLLAGINWFAFGSGSAGSGLGMGESSERLAVVWTSGDPDVAHRVGHMYTHNAKKQGWFEEVRLIIWGPSQRALVGDKDLQESVRIMQEDGVYVQACIHCAKSYGIVGQLRELDIEVKPMGVPLTEHIKSDWHVITF